MSAVSHRRSDTVAGFLCAFSFALSGIALVRQPGLLAPVAILLALVATRMAEARHRLAAASVLVAGLAFLVGMSIAVWAGSPLF